MSRVYIPATRAFLLLFISVHQLLSDFFVVTSLFIEQRIMPIDHGRLAGHQKMKKPASADLDVQKITVPVMDDVTFRISRGRPEVPLQEQALAVFHASIIAVNAG